MCLEAMVELMRLAHSAGSDLVILSDANTVYIETILKVRGVSA